MKSNTPTTTTASAPSAWARRCAAALCAGILALALSGCASTGSPSSQEPSSSASQAASSEAAQQFAKVSDVSHSKSASASSAAASSDAASAKSPAASPEKAALDKLVKDEVKPIIKASGMGVCVSIVDLESGESANVDGDKDMVSASMIKPLIAAAFLKEVDEGSVSLTDTYVLEESDIVGGTGSLGGLGAGAKVTYDDILERMIAESDNTATNILIDKLGMDAVNDMAKELKLKKTRLERRMMDEEAVAAGMENHTSANDLARIFELAYDEKLVSPDASNTLMSALRRQTDSRGIAGGLPSDAVFAHKTGTLGSVQHDGGVVETKGTDGRDFVIVVLCGGEGFSQQGAFDTMADLGKAVYEGMQKLQSD